MRLSIFIHFEFSFYLSFILVRAVFIGVVVVISSRRSVNLLRHESMVNVFFLLVDFSYCFTFLIFPKNPSDQNSCSRSTCSTSTSTPYVTMATVRDGHSVSLHLPITSPIKHLSIIYPRWRTKRRMTSCPSFAVILS